MTHFDRRQGARTTQKPLEIKIPYVDTSERRVIDLTSDGIPCIPVLGLCNYRRMRPEPVEHIHPGCLEISFCQRGSLAFESGGKKYPFLPGHIFVSRPDQPHRMLSNPKGLLTYWLFFRIPKKGSPLLGLPHDEAEWLRQQLLCFPRRLFEGNSRIRQGFVRIFQTYDTEPRETPRRRLFLRNMVVDLLLSILNAANSQREGLPNSRLRSVIEEIREHPERTYSINSLAARLALSPSLLISLFKQETGLPPHAFLLDCRIACAKRLLAETTDSIGDIADRLLFASSQHFAAYFKHAAGMTPSQWRHTAEKERLASRKDE